MSAGEEGYNYSRKGGQEYQGLQRVTILERVVRGDLPDKGCLERPREGEGVSHAKN